VDLQTAKNVIIKVLQVLWRCAGEESRLHWIHTRGCEADNVKEVNILSLGEKNSKIFSESERIRISIENSGETLQVQMTVEVVAVVIHRRTRHLNYQYRAVVNF